MHEKKKIEDILRMANNATIPTLVLLQLNLNIQPRIETSLSKQILIIT